MAQFDWENLLQQFSLKLIEYDIKECQEDITREPKLTPELRQSGWLGYPGATEQQIITAETRLGIKFPPSYREFLKVSNGWRNADWTEIKLWSTEELAWFSTRNQEWIDAWVPYTDERPSIPDNLYFAYGEEQDCIHLRCEYLQNALEISSDSDDGDILLLIPDVVFDNQELEAWQFGNKLPGANRYRSFYELMQTVVEQGSFIY